MSSQPAEPDQDHGGGTVEGAVGRAVDVDDGPDPLQASLWDQAYESLKADDSKGLVKDYEKIVGREIEKVNKLKSKAGKSSVNATVQISTDRTTRRAQMMLLVKARQETSKAGGTVKDVAEGAAKVVEALKEKIASALEAYPPAGLAFAGFSLLLNSGVASIKASKANIKALEYVISRLDWYTALSPQMLRDKTKPNSGKAEIPGKSAADIDKIRKNINDRILDLFKSLITFEMKSVVRYYRWNRLATFLKDQMDLNDWKGDADEVKEAEARLFADISLYDAQLGLELQAMHAKTSQETSELMGALLKLQIEQAAREERREARDIAHEDEAIRRRISELIRVFSVDGLNYKAFKNTLNQQADAGTCLWFKQHEKYANWREAETGVLLVTAPPGCGKSVLSRTLVDDAVAVDNADEIICYFFFKVSSLQNQPEHALCAVLHQLFQQRRRLTLDVARCITDEKEESLQHDREKLWDIFEIVIRQLDPDDQLICFFDALDECEEEGRTWFIEKMSTLLEDPPERVKFMMTSRPYESILVQFDGPESQLIELQTGDLELSQIGSEIDIVIDNRLSELAGRRRQPPSAAVVEDLRQKLKAVQQRTYLWVRLIFQLLGKVWLSNEDSWMEPVLHLPPTVDDAYETLLRKVPAESIDDTHQILSIVVAAFRPLTVVELRLAHQQYCKLENRPFNVDPINFEIWLSNTCGFAVHVFERRVQFIHQTVREFLASVPAKPGGIHSHRNAWKASVSLPSAHRILAEASIAFLSTPAFMKHPFVLARYPFPIPDYRGVSFAFDARKVLGPLFSEHQLLEYASVYWVNHFRFAQEVERDSLDKDTFRDAKQRAAFEGKLIDIRKSLWQNYLDLVHKPSINLLVWWMEDFDSHQRVSFPRSLVYKIANDFIIGAECGHWRLILHAKDLGHDIDARNHDRRTALHTAIVLNDLTAVRWLLYLGASLTLPSRARTGMPVQLCRTEAMLDMLLLAGADINERDLDGNAALHTVCAPSHLSAQPSLDMINLLISRGADLTTKTADGSTALHFCSQPGIMTRLLEAGADIDARDAEENTPLHVACADWEDREWAAKLLILSGANTRAVNRHGWTPLHVNTRLPIAQLLLEKGADRFAPDYDGRTPLAIVHGIFLQKLRYYSTTEPVVLSREHNELLGWLADLPLDTTWYFQRILQDTLRISNYVKGRPIIKGEILGMVAERLRTGGIPFKLQWIDLRLPVFQQDFRLLYWAQLWTYFDVAAASDAVDNVNFRDSKGNTLLQAACHGTVMESHGAADESHVKLLLDTGLSPDLVDGEGLLPLQHVLSLKSFGDYHTMAYTRLLLHKCRRLHEIRLNGKPPLLFCLDRQLELSQKGRDVNLGRRVRAFAEVILPLHADACNGIDDDGNTALHYLCGRHLRNGMRDRTIRAMDMARLVTYFLRNGTDPRVKNLQGYTAFQLLLTATDQVGSLDWEADKLVYNNILEALLGWYELRSNLTRPDDNGNTLWHELCSTLPDRASDLGELWFLNVVNSLQWLNIDPNCQNNDGETALHCLLTNALSNMDSAGAKFDDIRRSKDPLRVTIMSAQMIVALLRAGSNPAISNAAGVTAVDRIVQLYCLRNSIEPVIQELRLRQTDMIDRDEFIIMVLKSSKRATAIFEDDGTSAWRAGAADTREGLAQLIWNSLFRLLATGWSSFSKSGEVERTSNNAKWLDHANEELHTFDELVGKWNEG